MVYQWKMPLYSVPAQKAGEEMERITKTRGALTPSSVVEESRPSNAVLHNCFEWDDERAAERYRESQAAALIRNIVVTNVDGHKTRGPVRAFVSVEHDYKPVGTVIKCPEYKQSLLADALAEAEAYKRKYSTLIELSDLMRSIDRTIQRCKNAVSVQGCEVENFDFTVSQG